MTKPVRWGSGEAGALDSGELSFFSKSCMSDSSRVSLGQRYAIPQLPRLH